MKHTAIYVVQSELGIHARPAVELVKVSRQFQAEVVVSANSISADAKSILALLSLGVAKGSKLTVTAEGVDAVDAMHAFRQTSLMSGLMTMIWSDFVDGSRQAAFTEAGDLTDETSRSRRQAVSAQDQPRPDPGSGAPACRAALLASPLRSAPSCSGHRVSDADDR